MPNTIGENILRIRERMARAQRKSARAEEVTLIAVSKTQPAEMIRAAYEAGIRHFGENRVQEWEGKRLIAWTLWMIFLWRNDWMVRGRNCGRRRNCEY
jgi:hypothetical protein